MSSSEEQQRLNEAQFERRLERVWRLTLAIVVGYPLYVVGGIGLQLLSVDMEFYASLSQEVTSIVITAIAAYLGGAALGYRRTQTS